MDFHSISNNVFQRLACNNLGILYRSVAFNKEKESSHTRYIQSYFHLLASVCLQTDNRDLGKLRIFHFHDLYSAIFFSSSLPLQVGHVICEPPCY